VANGKATPEQLQQLAKENADLLYDVWQSDANLDPHGRLASRLLADHGPSIMTRLRRSLVVGNAAQKQRALQLLKSIEPNVGPEALTLLRYTLRRAAQRGERDLERLAADLLAKWESEP